MSTSSPTFSMIDFLDEMPPNVATELKNRYNELSRLESEQLQMTTTSPQLFGTLSKFIANPSTVSVETFKRMNDTDDTIGSGIDFMTLAMTARFGDYKHPSQEVQSFVRRALAQMEGSFTDNLGEMFSAEWNGFSVTEQVWRYEPDFDGFPAFVPSKLVTLPPLTIVFAVDRNGVILPDGIYQYQRFHNSFFNSYLFGGNNGDIDGFRPDFLASVGDYPYPIRVAADLTYLTVKVPKEKCIHLTSSVSGKFGNPYGLSVLRRCYKHWVSKDAYLKMRLIALDRKGTPLLIGYAAPNDTVLENVRNHPDSNNVMAQRADLAMANAFKTLHNSSFVALPGKKGEIYEIEAIQVQGDMMGFRDAVDDSNRGIMRSLLLPPLVLGGDGGGSYSLGQEHYRIFKQVVDGKTKHYKQELLDQFVKKIIKYNFPGSAQKDGYGEFLLEDYDPEVMLQLSQVYRELTDTGYMSPSLQSDLDHVRTKVGLTKKKVEPIDPEGFPDADTGDGEADESHTSAKGFDVNAG